MHHVTAFVGAVIVFVGVVVAWILVSPALPAALQDIHVGPIVLRNMVGILLAIIAAASSYRATVGHYRRKSEIVPHDD